MGNLGALYRGGFRVYQGDRYQEVRGPYYTNAIEAKSATCSVPPRVYRTLEGNIF